MTTGVLDMTRLRALLRNALDPATTEEARRSFAVRVCEELFKLGFADEGKVFLPVDRASSFVNVPRSNASTTKPKPARPRGQGRGHPNSREKVVVTAVPGSKKGFREVE